MAKAINAEQPNEDEGALPPVLPPEVPGNEPKTPEVDAPQERPASHIVHGDPRWADAYTRWNADGRPSVFQHHGIQHQAVLDNDYHVFIPLGAPDSGIGSYSDTSFGMSGGSASKGRR